MNRGRPVFGVIADDYTGATDVASAIRGSGLSTALLFGPSSAGSPAPDGEAVVVGLKSRTIPPDEAVRVSLDVLAWLTERGASRIYFKYCSTFDSTDAGNIGPVADALLDTLGGEVTVVCPASPEHGRTVYQGHLFVGSQLLSESPMRDHPLTPMRDSDLVAVLGRQTARGVALIDLATIRRGARAIRERLAGLVADGTRYAVVDVVDDDDLASIAAAVGDAPLATGGAGLARHLAIGLARDRAARAGRHAAAFAPAFGPAADLPPGRTLILSGSLSKRTGEQIDAALAAGIPAFGLDPAHNTGEALDWLAANGAAPAALVHSWAPRHERSAARSSEIEATMAAIACAAATRGFARIVVAGGETAGAVVEALGIDRAVVVAEEDRGVPWLLAPSDPPLALLLKSGNFGGRDLFVRAASR